MNCPKCHQVVESGATFCGNCGQALQQITQAPTPGSPIPAAAGPTRNGVPSYAVAKPGQHRGDTKALLSVLFGITGLIGLLFMAIMGLVLGVAGIVMGTMSRSSARRRLSTIGLIISSLAIIISLAVWVYVFKHDPRLNQSAKPTDHNISTPAVSASELSTPCYSVGFVDKLNITNDTDSCDMNAFNGATLSTSTNAYKIYADTSSTANAQNFATLFKPALEKDVQTTLPGFTIDSEKSIQFAGSPAYAVTASSSTQHVAVIEAIVLHRVAAGSNVFVLVHAVNGSTADLNTLEAEWQWK